MSKLWPMTALSVLLIVLITATFLEAAWGNGLTTGACLVGVGITAMALIACLDTGKDR